MGMTTPIDLRDDGVETPAPRCFVVLPTTWTINLETVKAFGLRTTQSLLLRADEVIK
jgi:hypothetical protein